MLFDVLGVILTLVLWETDAALGYVIWFVVGVFCAAFIYPIMGDADPDSPAGRRNGLLVVVITTVTALVLGMLSSLAWSASGNAEAFAPNHRGMTITYLVTVVLAVAWARFVLFREPARAETHSVSQRS